MPIVLLITVLIGAIIAQQGIFHFRRFGAEVYISRMREAIDLQDFAVGLIKAPFMGLIIGAVAGVQGLAVQGSAESLGTQTTTSVVKSIFLVIVLDGVFAVFFASIGM